MIEEYAAQTLGLTEREAHLLLACLNGIVMHRVGDQPIRLADCKAMLVANVSGAAEGAGADYGAFGIDLDLPESGTAETQYEYRDLAEKLAAMTDEQAMCLVWWVTGVWEGIDKAAR
jgi:hypothetical protein